MDNKNIINRIIKKVSNDNILNSLVNKISFTDLQSLLLEVYKRKVKKLQYKDVLQQYEKNRFVKPSNTSPMKLCEIDIIAFSLLSSDYTVLELSPTAPLGCASVLGPVDQNNIITTIRNTEICSDLTNVLALECAKRRREFLKKDIHSTERVKLCSSQRLLRTQPTKNVNSFSHFRLLGLCTSGRDEGSYKFEEEIMIEHIDFYIRLIDKLNIIGYEFAGIELELIIYDPLYARIEERVNNEIKRKNYSVNISFSAAQTYEKTYYNGIGFHLYGINTSGEKLFLVDGGFTDWTQKLLSNKKERLMISGMGTERVVHCFL